MQLHCSFFAAGVFSSWAWPLLSNLAEKIGQSTTNNGAEAFLVLHPPRSSDTDMHRGTSL